MKLTQKLLAAILAMVMLVCILPMAASAAETTYVLDAKEHLSPMAEKTKADGDTDVVGPDSYFTIHYSEKTKIDESEKTFEDGYESNQRLNFAGKAQVKPNGTTKNVVEFTTSGPATVKIWWVQGGDDNRQMGIFNDQGELLTQTDLALEKNKPGVSTLEIAEAGKYFLGGVTNKNYIFKIEVTVSASEAPDEPAIATLEDGQYILSWGDLTFSALAAEKNYGYCPAGSLAAYTDADVVTIKNTADGKFTITDSLGRIVYMTGTYNSFNVAAEATEGYEWVLEDAGNGLYYLKNVEKGKYVSYSEQYSTWGSYADKAASGKLTITAVTPSGGNPDDGGTEGGADNTGDMIGVVIALLAVSGMGITVLKKRF